MFTAGATDVKLVKDKFSSNPTTQPFTDETGDIGVRAHLGLLNRIDAYYQSTIEGPSIFGGKLQVFGHGKSSATSGNFSLAIFGGALFGLQREESTQGDISVISKVRTSGSEYGLAIGYRIHESVLLYSNAHYSQMTADAVLDQTVSGVTTNSLVDVGGAGEFRTVALGFELGTRLFLQAEAAYSTAEWERTHPSQLSTEDFEEFLYGVNAGMSW